MTAARSTGCDVEAKLAGDDAAHVEQVVDELRLDAGVALDDLEASLKHGGVGRVALAGAATSRGSR